MMNENMNEINELNEKIVPLTEEELAEVAGGRAPVRFIA